MSYGVAVLGTGRIGGRYIDVVKETKGAHPVVVAEPRAEQVVNLREKHPSVVFVSDYKQALQHPDVDIALITLPHGMHKEAAITAAQLGIHIYTEKPLATWAKDAREMLRVAKDNNVKLMTAHTQRYYPVVKKAKQLIDSGEFGSLIMLYDMWHKPYQPYKRPRWMLDRDLGGGMGQMDGTHQIDRALWLVGDDVESVSAIVGQFTYPQEQHPDIKCDDTGMLFIKWQSGVAATLSRIAWEKGALDYGADIFLTKGMIRFRIQYGSGSSKTGVWVANTPSGEWLEVPFEDSDSLLDEFSDFVQSLQRGDTDTPIPQMHGLKVLEVLEASERSASTVQEVKFPI